jgi:hypothetical protein
MSPSSFTADIFSKLGEYAHREGITYSVLSGYDPSTDTFGRDLDVYIPNREHADQLLFAFWRILGESSVPWRFFPDPIWGRRCVGVSSTLEYAELHTFTDVRVGPLVVSTACKPMLMRGPNGLLYDPLYIFTKKVLTRMNRRILAGKPLWNHTPPPAFLNAYSEEIDGRTAPGFTETMLGDDTPERLRKRQTLLLAFLSRSVYTPSQSFSRSVAGIWKKKLSWIAHPCTPFFFCRVPESSPTFENKISDMLHTSLNHIFPEIQITRDIVSPGRIRRMQSRQQLLVCVGTRKNRYLQLLPGYTPFPEAIVRNMDQVIPFILDATVKFNAGFNDIFTH